MLTNLNYMYMPCTFPISLPPVFIETSLPINDFYGVTFFDSLFSAPEIAIIPASMFHH